MVWAFVTAMIGSTSFQASYYKMSGSGRLGFEALEAVRLKWGQLEAQARSERGPSTAPLSH